MKEESAEKEEEEKGGVPQQPEDIKMDEEKEATEDNEDEEDEEADKTKKLKKLFYKIADLTHPDKAIARGDSQVQTKRLEAIFRKAKEAYNDLNWYVLYSIALDLGLPVEDPTEETITWLEADIKSTLGKISEIACLVVWVWYVGDTNSKNMAIASYLQQTFDFTWTPTLEPTES
jgi:molecular chaperone GrpE (heat shock protein)